MAMVDIDIDNNILTFRDKMWVQADLIVGAGGVHVSRDNRQRLLTDEREVSLSNEAY